MELSYRNDWIDEQNKNKRPFVKQTEGRFLVFCNKKDSLRQIVKKMTD